MTLHLVGASLHPTEGSDPCPGHRVHHAQQPGALMPAPTLLQCGLWTLTSCRAAWGADSGAMGPEVSGHLEATELPWSQIGRPALELCGLQLVPGVGRARWKLETGSGLTSSLLPSRYCRSHLVKTHSLGLPLVHTHLGALHTTQPGVGGRVAHGSPHRQGGMPSALQMPSASSSRQAAVAGCVW